MNEAEQNAEIVICQEGCEHGNVTEGIIELTSHRDSFDWPSAISERATKMLSRKVAINSLLSPALMTGLVANGCLDQDQVFPRRF